MKTLRTIITAPLAALIALGMGLWELWLPVRGWLRRQYKKARRIFS